jgi:hypothetical protein
MSLTPDCRRRSIRSAAILIKKLSGSSATFTLYFGCLGAIGAKHFRNRQMKTRPKLNFGRVLLGVNAAPCPTVLRDQC